MTAPGPGRYIVKMMDEASADLESIAAFIAKDSPVNALRLIERLEKRVRTLAIFPRRGHPAPESGLDGYTLLQIIESPFRIVYSIEGDTVWVHHIPRSSQLPRSH